MRPSLRSRLPLTLLAVVGFLPVLLLRATEGEERRYALIVGVKNYKKDQFRMGLPTRWLRMGLPTQPASRRVLFVSGILIDGIREKGGVPHE
jgi:hypothetical protein